METVSRGDDLAALWLLARPEADAAARVGRIQAAYWVAGMYVPGGPVFEGSEPASPFADVFVVGTGAWQWRDLLVRYDDWDHSIMARIIDCESGGRADAIGGPNYDTLFDYGLYQLHGDPRGLDPGLATEIAHEKYEASGYAPWVSSRGCWA